MDSVAKGIEECLEGGDWKLRSPFMYVAGIIDYTIATADEMKAHRATLRGNQKDPRATERDYSLYGWGDTTASMGQSLAFLIASRTGLKTEAYIILADYITRAVNHRRTRQRVGLIGTARSLAYKVREKLQRPAEDLEDAVEELEERPGILDGRFE